MASEVINDRKELTVVTPMMQQYLDVKNQYEDYILMYRLGDFYECFFEDAVTASRELELTLTARDAGGGKRAAMCGVPFHKADVYVGKLVEKGFRVAICEQIGDPKAAVGIVKREVTRVVTPGTVTDSEVLSEEKNNYLMALYFSGTSIGLAVIDVSTSEISATYLDGENHLSLLRNEIATYRPAEILTNIKSADKEGAISFAEERFSTVITGAREDLFSLDRCGERVRNSFSDTIDKITSDDLTLAIGALILYIEETQKTEIAFLRELNIYKSGQFLDLDLNTVRNLELVENMRTKEKRGSLLWVLDKTKTAMGKRLLRSFIQRPLLDTSAILSRQSCVADLVKERIHRDNLAEILSDVLDMERLTAKAVYGTANAKDLRSICDSLKKLPDIKSIISELSSDAFRNMTKDFDTLDEIADILDRAIVDVPPYTVREGGMIRDGFDSDIDYYRSIKNGGSDIMRSIEERERELTGIKTLKVDYNRVFGYYIEVTKSFSELVPDRYVRKQTLVNCERYITDELKEMETTIFNADEKLVGLEYNLFDSLRNLVSDNRERIRAAASIVASVDVYRSLAEVAAKNNYVAPEVDLSTDIIIKDGRHPVVEKFVSDSYFVPNDTLLDTGHNKIMIITGPNMAGKSTYMRQVAIITLMAQIGSFVPAREARIGIVDKLFTRVGASDDLASGQSTFMLEMSEVATILRRATPRSLIIYDEVGRGTSTYDGMAIARAVVEYTYSKKIGAKTLFATHYHELTDMEDLFDGIVNYNIAAKKRGDSIIFLRKIVRGGTDDSYGIEVAKLAGVPSEVVRRAKEILAEIESPNRVVKRVTKNEEAEEPDLFTAIGKSKAEEVADRLRETDINTMTPIEAIALIYELKKSL